MQTKKELEDRMEMERKVVRHLIRTAKKHGYAVVKVWDGEENVKCSTEAEAMDAVFEVGYGDVRMRRVFRQAVRGGRMSTKHTPEPWAFSQYGPQTHIATVAHVGTFAIGPKFEHSHEVCYDDHGSDEDDARRIVACVNACDGIDTYLLEGFSPRFLATLPDRHLKQRTELLNALRRLSFAAIVRDNTMGDQCGLFAAQSELRDANKQAMDAIAKATGAAA